MNRYAIGENIKRFLAKKGWTMTRLAQEMHVTQNAVGHWVHGKRTPNAYALYRMAKALDTTMEKLVEGIDEQKG